MWWRLLSRRPPSAAAFFDVDWQAAGGKVVVPQLGSPLEELIERDEIRLTAGPNGGEIRGPVPLRAGTAVAHYTDVSEVLTAQHYRLQWWREPFRNSAALLHHRAPRELRVGSRGLASTSTRFQERRLVDHPGILRCWCRPHRHLRGPDRVSGTTPGAARRPAAAREEVPRPGEWLPQSWPVGRNHRLRARRRRRTCVARRSISTSR